MSSIYSSEIVKINSAKSNLISAKTQLNDIADNAHADYTPQALQALTLVEASINWLNMCLSNIENIAEEPSTATKLSRR